jgi:hypothetical protein
VKDEKGRDVGRGLTGARHAICCLIWSVKFGQTIGGRVGRGSRLGFQGFSMKDSSDPVLLWMSMCMVWNGILYSWGEFILIKK